MVPLSSFIEVYIEVEDVNDNAPQTSEPVYYPEIMENSPKDVSVVQIEAFDPDSSSSDKLTYKITSGNPQGFFSIHPKTGRSILLSGLCMYTLQFKTKSWHFFVARFSLVWHSPFFFQLFRINLCLWMKCNSNMCLPLWASYHMSQLFSA